MRHDEIVGMAIKIHELVIYGHAEQAGNKISSREEGGRVARVGVVVAHSERESRKTLI